MVAGYLIQYIILYNRENNDHVTKGLLGQPTSNMGPRKYKNERISVGYFCGKRDMGAKKTERVQKNFVRLCFFLSPPTERGQKTPTHLRKCSRLSKHCTEPAFEDEVCPKRTK